MHVKTTGISNLLLMAPFIYALVRPEDNIDFIYDTSIMLFIAEFLSIHSTGMLSGIKKENIANKIPLFLFYMVSALALLFGTKSPQIFYFLIISFVTKFFINKAAPHESTVVKPLLVLLSTVFLVIISSGLLKLLIPLPGVVLASKPTNTGGLFVDVPQTVLVWGLIYPIGLYLISFVNIPFKVYVGKKSKKS